VIVTVAQQKGGVGKTTTALNLAAELSRAGRRVLAVDLDPQFALTRQLGTVSSALQLTLVDVLGGRSPADEAVVSDRHGIDVLPAHRDLSAIELALVGEIGRESFVADALASLSERYDDIVIDTPPNLGLLTVNGLLPADVVVAPVSAEDEGSAQGLAELRATIARLERLRGGKLLPITAITTKWRQRRIMTSVVETAVASLGLPITTRVPKRSILQQAAVHRLPLRSIAPHNDCSIAYSALAQALLTQAAG
jgi:chromosome partitioning protein